jgi:hypothetical protein
MAADVSPTPADVVALPLTPSENPKFTALALPFKSERFTVEVAEDSACEGGGDAALPFAVAEAENGNVNAAAWRKAVEFPWLNTAGSS